MWSNYRSLFSFGAKEHISVPLSAFFTKFLNTYFSVIVLFLFARTNLIVSVLERRIEIFMGQLAPLRMSHELTAVLFLCAKENVQLKSVEIANTDFHGIPFWGTGERPNKCAHFQTLRSTFRADPGVVSCLLTELVWWHCQDLQGFVDCRKSDRSSPPPRFSVTMKSSLPVFSRSFRTLVNSERVTCRSECVHCHWSRDILAVYLGRLSESVRNIFGEQRSEVVGNSVSSRLCKAFDRFFWQNSKPLWLIRFLVVAHDGNLAKTIGFAN